TTPARARPGGGRRCRRSYPGPRCFTLRTMDIKGASAIVTGGASGIGAATARRLAARGATVVIADLNAEAGEKLAQEIDGAFVSVDVTDTAQIEAAVDKALELGPLKALVNSAG